MSVTLDTVKSTCTEPVSVLSEVHSLWPEAVVLRRWFHLLPELSSKSLLLWVKLLTFCGRTGFQNCTSVQRLIWLLSFVAEEAQDLA
jgi:hypothetical protein